MLIQIVVGTKQENCGHVVSIPRNSSDKSTKWKEDRNMKFKLYYTEVLFMKHNILDWEYYYYLFDTILSLLVSKLNYWSSFCPSIISQIKIIFLDQKQGSEDRFRV